MVVFEAVLIVVDRFPTTSCVVSYWYVAVGVLKGLVDNLYLRIGHYVGALLYFGYMLPHSVSKKRQFFLLNAKTIK